MVDRAEVISQLERCTLQTDLPIRTHRDACAICHYKRDDRCNFTSLMADALALLKEQEPVVPKKWVPKGQAMARVMGYYCPVCNTNVTHGDRFCHWCGRGLKWDE